jgi:hypothetical protein
MNPFLKKSTKNCSNNKKNFFFAYYTVGVGGIRKIKDRYSVETCDLLVLIFWINAF